jgi:hypothetical protein
MTCFHAVVWTDHHHAQILQFDAEHIESQKVKAHAAHARQHGGVVRTEHEFFAQLCDAFKDVPEVLVTGSHQSLADFRHYVEKHRPGALQHIVGWEVVNHPTEGQLVAQARQYFRKYDRMVANGDRS